MKNRVLKRSNTWLLALWICFHPALGLAWHDETHIAIAKAAGYEKWFNAAGADITKIKAGDIEKRNHYVYNPSTTIVTAQMVLGQADRYNVPHDTQGHLYGAIIAATRAYRTTTQSGKYAEYHMAFCAHYVGDLSQPLHNILYSPYNQQYHTATDGIINHEVLNNLSLIEMYPIEIRSEMDLANEIARIANLSLKLGYWLEKEERILSRQEAYEQLSHSASLLRAILTFVKGSGGVGDDRLDLPTGPPALNQQTPHQ
ncbi:MAG: hypothetical protein KFF68_10165 [Desulfosarcina sp.]|nr:hypothetical protein [Desulfosarcina sp.]